MESRKKILDKAKKLKELADRGVGGEKINAKTILDNFMAKHNISIDEISVHSCKGSRYNNMSDEQFLKEMAAEFLTLGIGYLLSKLIKQETVFTNGHAFHVLQKKYTEAVEERIKKNN